MTPVIPKQMLTEQLSNQPADDNIRISIILPLEKFSANNKADTILIQKAVANAQKYLHQNFEKEVSASLSTRLDELCEETALVNGVAGIGLFVSQNVKRAIPFRFSVKEKVIVSDRFEIRDLIYEEPYASPYKVLHLTGQEVRLFQGESDILTEIKDEKFPRSFIDDYEYTHPSRGSSYVGEAFVKEYEREKSSLKKIRYEHFLKEVDDLLSVYLKPGEKLLMAGVASDLAHFRRQSRYISRVAGQIPGNYTYRPVQELADSAWHKICASVTEQHKDAVLSFKELIGKQHALSGLNEIWKAAAEGRGYKLMVEKDFMTPGFLKTEDRYHLHLKPPTEPYIVLPDVANSLIDTVLHKNGEIIVVDNDMLADFGRIGLITRY